MRSAVLRFLKKQSRTTKRFLGDSRGATAIEYGLIAALISVVIIGAVSAVGTNLGATFNAVSANLTSN